MAHEILIGNGRASMFYVDDEPWHGLGTKLEKAPASSAEAVVAAGISWEVMKAPVYVAGTGRLIPIEDHFAIVRKDRLDCADCKPFGLVGRDFVPLQNRDAFRFFDPLLSSGHVTFETAGALGRGERIWVLARFKGDVKIGPDELKRYLLLSNRHDGKESVTVKFTPIRVVCQNTLSAAMAGSGRAFRVRHDRLLESRLHDTGRLIEQIYESYERLETAFESLRSVSLDDAELDSYIEHVFPDPPREQDGDGSRRRRALKARLAATHLCRNGRGNSAEGVKGTLWAAYNGIAEYVDHRKLNARGSDFSHRRLRYVWFGEGAGIKQRALVCALERSKPELVDPSTLQ
jgi:phage/plasmid-like protein (TIGR03299 family)